MTDYRHKTDLVIPRAWREPTSSRIGWTDARRARYKAAREAGEGGWSQEEEFFCATLYRLGVTSTQIAIDCNAKFNNSRTGSAVIGRMRRSGIRHGIDAVAVVVVQPLYVVTAREEEDDCDVTCPARSPWRPLRDAKPEWLVRG